ncbi:MAG: class II aldolase/adducin family protein, partial [Granulosicoccus sp.]|nr:class II aldolase/adducin family protein [Granulosicoccus sp.]
MTSLNFEHEFNHLREFSARIGKNPCLVQGAGGNSSIKDNGTMWIKASGTWLANASEQTLFVPVALNPLLDALETADPRAEKATDFIVDAHEHQTLRPSIETTLHAVMPQQVVVHVHCVDTIALAIQTTAQKQLGECLKDFNWLWVPYFRPGLPLS